jgi:RNA polymerase sigma factor (sigma-70 family)
LVRWEFVKHGLAAWSALPGLADPAAFPAWLRGIVRHQAFRILRRRQFRTVPLTEAEELPSDEPPADHRLAQRQQATAALAAIAELPEKLREPATLFFVHECSHQDIATFLGLPVATVNNRLHAARSKLKERMLTMVTETLHSRALPDDFANRIGRLLEASGGIVEALFDPNAPPDILAEIVVSDEARRRPVSVQVIQRPGGGIVRGVAVSPIADLPRGSTVLNSGRQSVVERHRGVLQADGAVRKRQQRLTLNLGIAGRHCDGGFLVGARMPVDLEIIDQRLVKAAEKITGIAGHVLDTEALDDVGHVIRAAGPLDDADFGVIAPFCGGIWRRRRRASRPRLRGYLRFNINR